jgi:PBP1b-binding outer membrane lipoprotein LpoB
MKKVALFAIMALLTAGCLNATAQNKDMKKSIRSN